MARRATGLPAGLKPLLSRDQIARRLPGLAREVHTELGNAKRCVAAVVLQGAFVFAADLLRRFPPGFPTEIAFLRCESYGPQRRSTSGRVLLLQDIEPDMDLRGCTVLLLDDILDTGVTIRFLMAHLRRHGAARVCPCVLLRRRTAANRRCGGFAGFDIGREFVVGYGLDLDGRYRHLPDLAALARAK